MFDYNQMLAQYSAIGQYSAKAEKEAQLTAKKAQQDADKATKQTKQIFAGKCGNRSCRICYGISAARDDRKREQNQDRKRAEKDVQDFMQEQRRMRQSSCVERIAHGEISI